MAIPTDIANLQCLFLGSSTLYQDAARTTLATADTDPVGSWTDTSGNNNHAFSSSTARPLLKLAIVNGQRVLRFDGVNDILELTARLLMPSWSLYAVVSVPDSSTRTLTCGAALNSMQWRIDTLKQQIVETSTALAAQGATSLTANTFTQVNMTFDTVTKAYVLRTAQAADASGTSTPNVVGGPMQFIGKNGFAGSEFFKGDIAALMVYSGVHDLTTKQSLETYLQGIYGV